MRLHRHHSRFSSSYSEPAFTAWAFPSVHHDRAQQALPTFPCITPTEFNSLCGLACDLLFSATSGFEPDHFDLSLCEVHSLVAMSWRLDAGLIDQSVGICRQQWNCVKPPTTVDSRRVYLICPQSSACLLGATHDTRRRSPSIALNATLEPLTVSLFGS